MPLQKEVVVKSAEVSEGRGYIIVFNLTCWPDAVVKEYPTTVNGVVDMKNAVIYQDFYGLIKKQVEGVIETDLISRLTSLEVDMQEVINDFIAKDRIETGATLETVRSTIEGGLTG